MTKGQSNEAKSILAGAITAFVNADYPSVPDLQPSFITNNHLQGQKVLTTIEAELKRCISFDFSVAFVTESGLTPLLQTLAELEEAGIPGRILTTDYLSFSDPKALERLDAFSNVEVRLYRTVDIPDRYGFHAKGYLFRRANGIEKVLIGSSNLTNSALSLNKEWNLVCTSLEQGALVRNIRKEFETLWAVADPLADVIQAYRAIFEKKKQTIALQNKLLRESGQQPVVNFQQAKLEPNSMQTQFTANLERMIEQGADRTLLISATGTGKTYASAFGMRHLAEGRVLFLAHREQVLKQARDSFRRVLGQTCTYGLLSGTTRGSGEAEEAIDADYLFATMQTMSKPEVLEQFEPEDFDCIIIDEVHRAGSASYARIMEHFQPRLYLGMTASPDRPDGFDIYGLFDNNIVHEIRLSQALAENLLCPFHYFGITDLRIDGELINENSEFNHLVCDQRVDHIIRQSDFYGWSGNRRMALAFCSRNEEAKRLAAKLNERGLAAQALSGADSQEAREEAIRRLVSDDVPEDERLEFLLTVDIFNEGVDIPAVNQVLILRPTESPIIFVQQLGRGLRKAPDKEYVVVIDFIGNYQNNYMIPIALSDNRSYNKDAIRKFVMEGDRVIPGCSSVHFDAISKERIFKSIDNSEVTMRLLRSKYLTLRHKLGRMPMMVDFLDHGEVDPMLFVSKSKSYYRFLATQEDDVKAALSEDEQLVLEFCSRYFANGMRPHELLAIKVLVFDAANGKSSAISLKELQESVFEYGILTTSKKDCESAVAVLNRSFTKSEASDRRFGSVELVQDDGSGQLVRGQSLEDALKNAFFKACLMDLIDFGLRRCAERYAGPNAVMDGSLCLYEKYSRLDVCRLLNWPHDDSATVYGYRIKHGTCPIFVTYNKAEDIASSTQYEDEFENRRVFSWMTRSRVRLDSPEAQKIINADKDGTDIYLFIKKSDAEGSDFYYFGKVHPIGWKQTTQLDDAGNELPIVNFKLELEHPVRDDIYAYFEGPDEVSVALDVAM